jgi:hypothetical protein
MEHWVIQMRALGESDKVERAHVRTAVGRA